MGSDNNSGNSPCATGESDSEASSSEVETTDSSMEYLAPNRIKYQISTRPERAKRNDGALHSGPVDAVVYLSCNRGTEDISAISSNCGMAAAASVIFEYIVAPPGPKRCLV